MSGTVLLKDEVTTLEHSTLKVPYEILNKKFRASQKALDRDLSHVTTATQDLLSCVGKGEASAAEAASSLEGVVQKLLSLKRKAKECVDDELECARLCRVRIDHLKSYVSGEQTTGMKKAWRNERVNRMLVDHFLREGFYTSAVKLARNSGVEDLVDIDIFLACQKVEEALKNHNTAPCLNWCYDNRSKLRRMKSMLEFEVRLQDFIELVRANKRIEAIKYARKHFTSNSDHPVKDIKSAMGLLAFSPSTTCKRYKRLFSESRWELLIAKFRQENFNLFQLSPQSVLSVTLQAGISALKTPQCYKPEEFNLQCPVCSKPFNELAQKLPFAHCSQSYLICAISGCPMNEHNPPMALPNGYVYGEQALKEMAARNEGVVLCPRTKETFSFIEVKKVYVM